MLYVPLPHSMWVSSTVEGQKEPAEQGVQSVGVCVDEKLVQTRRIVYYIKVLFRSDMLTFIIMLL